MKYMGSKARLSKKILSAMPTLERNYVEPFAGGMNMVAAVGDAQSRHANELNHYVVAMFQAFLSGWEPEHIDRETYAKLKGLNGPDHLIGWAGVACSYSGKWFGGYAGIVETKEGRRDYQGEAIKNAIKQIAAMKGVTFSSMSYEELEIPDGSLVYCDPPYAGTTGYRDSFDSRAIGIVSIQGLSGDGLRNFLGTVMFTFRSIPRQITRMRFLLCQSGPA